MRPLLNHIMKATYGPKGKIVTGYAVISSAGGVVRVFRTRDYNWDYKAAAQDAITFAHQINSLAPQEKES
jgi:hypothetical protein